MTDSVTQLSYGRKKKGGEKSVCQKGITYRGGKVFVDQPWERAAV